MLEIIRSPQLSRHDLILLEQTVIEKARADSDIFAQYVFEYRNQPFHTMWHRFIDTHQYGAILSYRGSGKSEQITIPRSCWEIGRNPDIRIKIATESDDLASKILSKISQTLLENDRYHRVFPQVKKARNLPWTRKALYIERKKHLKDPTIEATGILTARTGGRMDLALFDDACGLRNSLLFPKMREVVKEAFFSNWLNMRDDPATFRWYVIGTPWHISDLVSDMRTNPGIPKCQETKVGPDFESPWPERHSSDYFREQMRIMGRRHFNRAYRLVALDDSEAWLNPDALLAARDFSLKAGDLIVNPDITKFTGVDLGHRSGEEHSPSVIFTVGYLPDKRRVPLDIRISHDASPLSIIKVLINEQKLCNSTLTMVENVGAQSYIVDLANQLGPGDHKIEGFFTSASSKFDIYTGVPGLFAEMENSKWVIPLGTGGTHDEACLCHMCRWMSELRDFPNGKIDTVMASWLAWQALRKMKERAHASGGFSIWEWGSVGEG